MAVKCCECGGTSFVKNSCYETVCTGCGLVVSTESRLENTAKNVLFFTDVDSNLNIRKIYMKSKNTEQYKRIHSLLHRNTGLTISERYYFKNLSILKPILNVSLTFQRECEIVSYAQKLFDKLNHRQFLRSRSVSACVISAVQFFCGPKSVQINRISELYNHNHSVEIFRALRLLDAIQLQPETRTISEFISTFTDENEKRIISFALKTAPPILKLSNRRLLYVYACDVLFRALKPWIKIDKLSYISEKTGYSKTGYSKNKIKHKLQTSSKYSEYIKNVLDILSR